MRNYYKVGAWQVICDVCGKECKSDEVLKRWDGAIVCPSDFEERQPLDFIRGRQERLNVPFTRPEPTDTFIPGPICTIEGRQGLAGIGTAGCATAGYVIPS